MSRAGHPDLLETVMNGTIPMRGRMIHSRDSAGNPSELAQDYDAKGRVSHQRLKFIQCCPKQSLY